jgi:hypothetical protein
LFWRWRRHLQHWKRYKHGRRVEPCLRKFHVWTVGYTRIELNHSISWVTYSWKFVLVSIMSLIVWLSRTLEYQFFLRVENLPAGTHLFAVLQYRVRCELMKDSRVFKLFSRKESTSVDNIMDFNVCFQSSQRF